MDDNYTSMKGWIAGLIILTAALVKDPLVEFFQREQALNGMEYLQRVVDSAAVASNYDNIDGIDNILSQEESNTYLMDRVLIPHDISLTTLAIPSNAQDTIPGNYQIKIYRTSDGKTIHYNSIADLIRLTGQ